MAISRLSSRTARRPPPSTGSTGQGTSGTSTRPPLKSLRGLFSRIRDRFDRTRGVRSPGSTGIGTRAPNAPSSPMTTQKANQLIETGKRKGILTPAVRSRAAIAANNLTDKGTGDVKQITNEQLQDALKFTAGRRQGTRTLRRAGADRLNGALGYINDAKTASDQRSRIDKALQGLVVEARTNPGIGREVAPGAGGAVPGKQNQHILVAKAARLQPGIYTPSTPSPRPDKKDGIITTPYVG